jgi:uncharacterized protein (TIGR02588 family)
MKAPAKNNLEWAVFAASALLIAVVLGTLVYFELTRPETPPELVVRTLGARVTASGFVVRVEVKNQGGEAAANARIAVELTGPGVPSEHGEITFAMVPRGSVRSGEVIFTRDPAAGTLRARVMGYERP